MTVRKLGWAVAVALASVLFALPLLLMLVAPLRMPGLPPPVGLSLWPDAPSLQSFRDAFSLVPLGRSLLNSALVCAIAVPGLLLVLAMVPMTAIWIPRFGFFNALGLVGTYVPLVAPALMGGNPLFVLLYFVAMRRIPLEMVEAARLEGAGLLRIWWLVVMPLVKPTSAAIALLAVVSFWGNFIDPLLYLRTEAHLTAPPMLHALELLGPTNWPVFLAGAVVVTLPVVVAFMVAQRFLSSLERGSGWLGR
jgi:multiple sugar transport system permease protein